jgi:hypothetical protein
MFEIGSLITESSLVLSKNPDGIKLSESLLVF